MKTFVASIALLVTISAGTAERIRHPGQLAQLGTHCTTTCTTNPITHQQTCQTHCY